MLPRLRDRKGRFHRGWHVTCHGYPRYHAGPHRGQYVHRVAMALHLDRPLRPGEEVHHKDHDKRNFSLRNLALLSDEEHNYITQWEDRDCDTVYNPDLDVNVSFDVAYF